MIPRGWKLWTAGGLALAGVGGIAFVLLGGSQGGPVNVDASDPELVRLGEVVYAEHCAACHGEQFEGQPDWRRALPDGTLPAPPHDETGHTWHHPDEQLFQITKQGVAAFAPEGYETDMPGYAEALSDDEIRAVLDFIKSTWPAEIRERQASITSRSQQ